MAETNADGLSMTPDAIRAREYRRRKKAEERERERELEKLRKLRESSSSSSSSDEPETAERPHGAEPDEQVQHVDGYGEPEPDPLEDFQAGGDGLDVEGLGVEALTSRLGEALEAWDEQTPPDGRDDDSPRSPDEEATEPAPDAPQPTPELMTGDEADVIAGMLVGLPFLIGRTWAGRAAPAAPVEALDKLWTMTDQERAAATAAGRRVILRYMSEYARYLPELMLVGVLGGGVYVRVTTTKKLERAATAARSSSDDAGRENTHRTDPPGASEEPVELGQ